MAKKQIKIKTFTNADKDVYKMCYVTGSFTIQDAIAVGSNLKRIKDHIKDGYLEIDKDSKKRGQPAEYKYNFTKKGLNKCRDINDVGYAYKRAGERHDRALRQEIIKDLTDKSKTIIELRTEKDWDRALNDKIEELRNSKNDEDRNRADEIEKMRKEGKISPPDGGYVTSTGEVVAIEIITKFYDSEQREAKHEFVRVMECQYREIDIN